MPTREIIEKTYRLYKKSGFLTKAYIRIKFRIHPLLKLESYVPREGRILDLGCGIGILSNLMQLTSPDRNIDGIDIDRDKIHLAQSTLGDRRNLSFNLNSIQNMSGVGYDTVIISDILYLIPFAQQEEILKRYFNELPSGGLLLIKEVDKRPLWKYVFNLLQERLAVNILKLTKGGRFFFRSSLEYKKLLSSIGYKIEILPLGQGFAYPHIVYICRK